MPDLSLLHRRPMQTGTPLQNERDKEREREQETVKERLWRERESCLESEKKRVSDRNR